VAALRAEALEVSRNVSQKEQQIADLEAQITEYRSRIDSAPTRESELGSLVRQADVSRKLYLDIVATREGLKATAAARPSPGALRVVEPARQPQGPISPNRPLWIGAGALAGLLAGMLIAAALGRGPHTLRTENEVASALGLPVLAAVPRLAPSPERRSGVGGDAGAGASHAAGRWR
jgi:uncharacterized protein involved in exopolysaccharide biosynthesis